MFADNEMTSGAGDIERRSGYDRRASAYPVPETLFPLTESAEPVDPGYGEIPDCTATSDLFGGTAYHYTPLREQPGGQTATVSAAPFVGVLNGELHVSSGTDGGSKGEPSSTGAAFTSTGFLVVCAFFAIIAISCGALGALVTMLFTAKP